MVIEECNTNAVPVVITYPRGRDLSGNFQGAGGIGGLLARTDHSILAIEPTTMAAHSYYHTDGNGNVTALVNTLQVLVAKYLYDPYGNVLSAAGPLASANVYQFSSKEWNQNSGLVYYLYRFYDPSLQRWPNRDPLLQGVNPLLSLSRHGGVGQGAVSLTRKGFSHGRHSASFDSIGNPNLYQFLQNEPISRFDATGLYTMDELYELYNQAAENNDGAMMEYWGDEINAAMSAADDADLAAAEALTAEVAAEEAASLSSGTVCAAGIPTAVVGGAVGYGAGHYISWGGENLHQHIGDGLYNACPGCWNWVFW